MKKKLRLIFLIISVVSVSSLLSQSTNPGYLEMANSDIYIIGTSAPAKKNVCGFFKITGKLEPIDRTQSFSFIVRSSEKDYDMWLSHYDYNLDQLRKIRPVSAEDSMIIEDMPLSRLKDLNVIDVDEFLRTKTRDEVWHWMMANDSRRVWVIDRNDFYKSSPSLPANDRMKLVETRIWTGTIPENILNQ